MKRTKENIYYDDILRNISAIQNIPREELTADMCTFALKLSSIAIMYIPENFLTYEDCLNVVKKNGQLLEFIPVKYKDIELCLEAIENDIYATEYIPEIFSDVVKSTLYNKAFYTDYYAISVIPDDFISSQMYFHALMSNGLLLEFIPRKKQTVILCTIAIKNNYNALKYVYNQTNELCFYALSINANAITLIRKKKYSMYLFAIRANAELYRYLPKKYLTKTIANILFTQDIYLSELYKRMPMSTAIFSIVYHEKINWLPKKKLINIIKNNYSTIIDIVNPSEELCLEALESDSNAYYHIEPTQETCLIAVQKRKEIIFGVPTLNKKLVRVYNNN